MVTHHFLSGFAFFFSERSQSPFGFTVRKDLGAVCPGRQHWLRQRLLHRAGGAPWTAPPGEAAENGTVNDAHLLRTCSKSVDIEDLFPVSKSYLNFYLIYLPIKRFLWDILQISITDIFEVQAMIWRLEAKGGREVRKQPAITLWEGTEAFPPRLMEEQRKEAAHYFRRWCPEILPDTPTLRSKKHRCEQHGRSTCIYLQHILYKNDTMRIYWMWTTVVVEGSFERKKGVQQKSQKGLARWTSFWVFILKPSYDFSTVSENLREK